MPEQPERYKTCVHALNNRYLAVSMLCPKGEWKTRNQVQFLAVGKNDCDDCPSYCKKEEED